MSQGPSYTAEDVYCNYWDLGKGDKLDAPHWGKRYVKYGENALGNNAAVQNNEIDQSQ